jgi:hypothetical protein
VLLLLAAAAIVPLPVAARLPALTALHRSGSAATDPVLSAEDGTVRIDERGYHLALDPGSGMVTVGAPDGREYTDFPIAVAGAGRLPPGSRRVTRRDGQRVVSRLLARDGTALEEAVLEPSADSFVVRLSALPAVLAGGAPRLLDDGVRGLDLAPMLSGFTPDPTLPPVMARPAVAVTGRTPFAPPPFDVELRAPPGWMGVGLVEVPAATAMRVTPDGGIGIDVPPALVAQGGDLGAGPPIAGLVRLPGVVVTFAQDPYTGLRAYHDALLPLGQSAAAAPPGTRPAWWTDPIVDTWGEQMALRAARSSPLYTAAWVQRLADRWRQRFGTGPVTFVIDSRWQARIGDPEPDPVRFGGIAGMRQLVDRIHARGDHVVLWWPLWARNIARVPPSTAAMHTAPAGQIVDPTAGSFDGDTASQVATLLGDGPGQLDADGLKLDWGYDIPLRLADPDRGWGASALLRYLQVLHADAHTVRPDALIDASAAAPQFAAVADAVRLYDAWSEMQWNRRAAVVSAVDPDSLIDGDGWQATPADTLTHAVASTVYGTPALYFVTRWMSGAPISSAVAGELDAIVGLSGAKGQGRARALGGGDWAYADRSGIRAQSFDGSTALLVWRSPSCGTAISTLGGRMIVPLGRPGRVTVRDGSGRAVAVRRTGRGVSLVMVAGRPYRFQHPGTHC